MKSFYTLAFALSMMCGLLNAQTNLFPKAPKYFGKVHNVKKEQLRSAEDETPVSLRSTLEPGHARPDSAVVETEAGIKIIKSVFSYNGDVITEIHYQRDSYTGAWETSNYTKEEYAFDSNGYQTLFSYWNYQDNVPQDGVKVEYAYTPNGMPLSVKVYNYKDGGWAFFDGGVYLYDDNGMLTGVSLFEGEELRPLPLVISGTPDNQEITKVIDGVTVLKAVWRFDPVSKKWLAEENWELADDGSSLKLESSKEYEYDAAGRLLLLKEISYGGGKGEAYVKTTAYTYEANGRKQSETYTGTYDGGTVDRNGDGLINDDDKYPYYNRKEYEYAGSRLAKISEYDYNGGLSGTIVFYYSGGSDASEPVAASEPVVYVHDGILTVQSARTEQITVYALSGEKLYEAQQQAGTITINANAFPQGILIVRGSSGWVKKILNV
ncbi:MAG: hypothetical protein LBQ68_02900 [Clostridiales bacterium]|jgi:hypothetical protein|nr:hypothetical protein [Clostridiales bacterium]